MESSFDTGALVEEHDSSDPEISEIIEGDRDKPGSVICPLKFLVENGDINSLKSVLYSCVWDRFSLDPTAGYEIPRTKGDGSKIPDWFLHAAIFTGCPVLVDYALRKLNGGPDTKTQAAAFKRKRSMDCATEARDRVNLRLDCKFPLTDTWIHRSFRLGLSPLHLACWRLDSRSIHALLAHGADANILALEETNTHAFGNIQKTPKDGDEPVGGAAGSHGNLWSTPSIEDYKSGTDATQSGLCPLHFIALGIRASPKTSLFAGIQESIMHDTCVRCEPSHIELNTEQSLHTRHTHQTCQEEYGILSSPACALLTERASSKIDSRHKSASVARCVQLLLGSSAKPDCCSPQNLLIGANPLDTILQPPMRIFYAPSAARGNQNPVALRRHDLAQTADHVIAACEVLLSHGATVSPTFLDLYAWRPGILDCFHLNSSEQARQLVKFCVRLGLFSTSRGSLGPFLRDTANARSTPHIDYNVSYRSAVATADTHDNTSTSKSSFTFDPMIVRRFVADVVNMEIALPLASVVLAWCPFSVLRAARKETAAAINNIRVRDGDVGPRSHDLNGSGLSELARAVRQLQLASLKHKCALVVLESVGFDYGSILSLPLPPPLKRGLTNLDL